jgi:hypothetical protein
LKGKSMLLVAVLAIALVMAVPVLAQEEGVPVAMVDCILGGPCIGTPGNDTITGSDKQDTIYALEGDDVIDPGNDLVTDYVFCGPGHDRINQEGGVLQYAAEPDVIADDCEIVAL